VVDVEQKNALQDSGLKDPSWQFLAYIIPSHCLVYCFTYFVQVSSDNQVNVCQTKGIDRLNSVGEVRVVRLILMRYGKNNNNNNNNNSLNSLLDGILFCF